MRIKPITRDLQITATGEDVTFTGCASVFGILHSQSETVRFGAFARSLWRWRGWAPAMLKRRAILPTRAARYASPPTGSKELR